MRKTISPILMFLLTLVGGVSAWAQTTSTWYSPGSRLSIENIAAGTDVFIYSMCRVNGNGDNFSRFIVSNYNNVSTLNKTPLTLVTNNVNCIWKVGSKTPIENEQGNVIGYEVTFQRKKGTETTPGYLGIGGASNATTVADAHKMVVSHWLSDPIVSDTEKSGTDVYYENEEGNAVEQSQMTTDDYIYLVSARTGKSLNTANGSFNTGNKNGYPIAFYSVNTATAPTAALNDLSVSSAPANGEWNAATKWYTFSINGKYIENTLRYCDENNKLLANKTTSSNELGALWAVVGDISNGYQLYNLAAGPGKVLGVTGSEGNARFTMVDATNPGTNVTTLFDITYDTDGWFIKKHGELFDHLNVRDPYLGLWNNERASSADGSKVQFGAVSDLSTYATTAHNNLLSRVNYWKKVPAIWADAASVYTSLSSSLPTTIDNTTINSVVEKHNEIGTAFINAVANKQFTAKSGVTDTNNGRYGKYMYVSSDNYAKGHIQTNTLDEVITIKPNKDLTIKLYSEYYQKYLGTPGGNTAAVNLNSAGNFDIYTVESGDDNKVIFCNNGAATMHLLNTLEISNHESKSDPASFWILNTDVSGNELNQVITDATAWKTNLNTFCTAQSDNISVSPRSLTTIETAITAAQSVYNNQSATEADRKAATRTLQAVYDKAKVSWLGDLGSIQRFRLKSNAITTSTTEGEVTTTTSYYLTMDQEKVSDEGNARLMAYSESNENQIFTLIPSGGKYIIVSNGKQLTDLGAWNTDMTEAGTPYAFEEVDIENGLFRIRTTKGLLGPNNGVTGSNLSTNKNAYIYSNHSGTRGNLTWVLELVAPNVSGTEKLQATLNAQTWTTTYGLDIINPEEVPCLQQYLDKRTEVEGILNGSTSSTQKEINAAQVNLELSYSDMLQNFIMQAAATQSYRLKYKCANDYYMTITPGVAEDNVVNVMTVTSKNPRKTQIFRLIPATGENAGKFYIKECATNKQIYYGGYFWNPSLSETEGILFTPEYTTLEGVDGIVLRLKNSDGSNFTNQYLSPSSANPADGAYAYTNQNGGTGASSYGYWIIEPTDLKPTLNSQIELARTYQTHLGTGLNQYSNTAEWTNETLSSNNDDAYAYANSTGAYADQDPINTELQSRIDSYTTFLGGISINQPKVGNLYRFKGKASNKYMCASATGQMSMVEANDGMASIFMLVEGDNVEGQPGYKFLSYQTGYYNKETHSNGALVAAAQSVRFYQAEDNAIGYYTLKTNYSDGSKYTYDNGNQSNPRVDRNSSYAANNCDWQIEEVAELPISVTNGYSKLGTFVSPVPLTKDDSRLKFYTGKIDGDYFKLEEFTGNVIPANVPFLIEYTGGQYANDCAYLQISSGTASLGEGVTNHLCGGLETVAKPIIDGSTIYTLQKTGSDPDADKQEFRKYTGTNIKGFRAYLPVPNEAQIRGMIFGGTTTDIEGATTETAAPVIYDLSGRRVQRATKGMYIVNGKKMYVK